MAPSEPSSLFPFPYRGQESPELPPSEPVTVISIADHAVIVQWSSSPFGKGGPDGSPKFSLRGVAPHPTLAVGQEERQAVFPPYSSVALRFRQALSRHILTRFARSGIPRCLDDAPARHGSQWRRTPLDGSRWGQWKNAVWGVESLYGVFVPGWAGISRPVLSLQKW